MRRKGDKQKKMIELESEITRKNYIIVSEKLWLEMPKFFRDLYKVEKLEDGRYRIQLNR